MNNLAILTQKLNKKPVVNKETDIKVVILPEQPLQMLKNDPPRPVTKITIEKDNGTTAVDILKRLEARKLTKVVNKFPEEQQIEEIDKAPFIPNEELAKKPKKQKATTILMEEQKEDIVEDEPQLVDVEQVPSNKPKARYTKRAQIGVINLGPEEMIQIGDTTLRNRLPAQPVYDIRASSYYMNNREIFINFINNLFEPYKEDLLDETQNISCDNIGKDTGKTGLLTHQKIVRDYINLYTPYRGLLLFHGLGSGKTCSSIAIAEGLKGFKQIIVLTPASLRRNYMEEIKKCGDLLFRKNQFWEWISVENNPEMVNTLSNILGLTVEYIKRRQGAWLVNVTKASNYDILSTQDKQSLNEQLDEMIQYKYKFINYNGLRREKFKEMTNNFETNIFDNSVVIVDEAHNLISRIVNKINKFNKFSEKRRGPGETLPTPLALQIYEFLLRAVNCRIVLLTGTPVINFPNEIGILFNILRGYIKTWNLPLNIETNKKINRDVLQDIFSKEKVLDYIDYVPSSKILTITRNPFGFENKIKEESGYRGVYNRNEKIDQNGKLVVDERGVMSDEEFISRITKILKKNDIQVNPRGITFTVNTALPDTLDIFISNFINKENGNLVNSDKFKRRIMGLTSYFKSAQEELLPKYNKEFDRIVVKIPMSNYQFQIYEEARQNERKNEKPNKKVQIDKDGLFMSPSSTYKIFSRLFCNFVMPRPPGRPNPGEIKQINLNLGQKGVRDEREEQREEQKEEMKAQEKIQQPKIPAKKAEDKEAKAQAKQLEKEAKALAKEREKEEKAQAKQLEKDAKAQAKQLEKELKAQAKAEEKEAKALAKKKEKEEKKVKGGKKDDDESDSDSDSNSDSQDEDEEEEEIDVYIDELEIHGGEGSPNKEEPYEEYLDSVEDEDEIIAIEGYKDVDANNRDKSELEGDEILEKTATNPNYKRAMAETLDFLKKYKSKYLSLEGLKTYSPKFLAMIENIDDPEHPGLHLVYSQFRSMEGIEVFSLALEANGFARFKITKTGADHWDIVTSDEDMGKPHYALYTGTEDSEEREIIRNIYNGDWNNIPNNIAAKLRTISNNNNMGEIIKVLMITSAGSEGINLRNTRYVHIMEPYWHPVRLEQVIGRARRICSHQALPVELRTVQVFIYIMTFTQEQLNGPFGIEVKLKDRSNTAPFLPQSSDEKLYEISMIKENLSSQILNAVKSSSIDCVTHRKSNAKEGIVCLSFGEPNVNSFSYNPNIEQDQNDTIADINRKINDWEVRPITIKTTGKQYMLRLDTNQIYDYDSVIQSKQIPGVNPILLGKLVKNKQGEYEIVRHNL